MKRTFGKELMVTIVALYISLFGFSQVDWKYSAKKTGDKTYELHITATIQDGWHIYAQKQPEGAIGLPTSFTFQKSPLVNLVGKVEEKGNLVIKSIEVLGSSQHEYHDSVDFIQKIKLKSNVKTNIKGSVNFMVCDEHQCMPPATNNFEIALK